MARKQTPEALFNKTMRIVGKALGHMNKKLNDGGTLSGSEHSALAGYLSSLRATIKQERAHKKDRAASTSSLSNEELAQKAAEILNKKLTTAPAVEGDGHGEEKQPVRD
jgi:hypothetical protein